MEFLNMIYIDIFCVAIILEKIYLSELLGGTGTDFLRGGYILDH